MTGENVNQETTNQDKTQQTPSNYFDRRQADVLNQARLQPQIHGFNTLTQQDYVAVPFWVGYGIVCWCEPTLEIAI